MIYESSNVCLTAFSSAQDLNKVNGFLSSRLRVIASSNSMLKSSHSIECHFRVRMQFLEQFFHLSVLFFYFIFFCACRHRLLFDFCFFSLTTILGQRLFGLSVFFCLIDSSFSPRRYLYDLLNVFFLHLFRSVRMKLIYFHYHSVCLSVWETWQRKQTEKYFSHQDGHHQECLRCVVRTAAHMTNAMKRLIFNAI